MGFRSKTTMMSDEQIIELYWQRNERALKETDIKYKKFLLAIAYNILHDMCDSEECLNDTYMGAWNAIPPEKPISLPAFLTTIMRRTAINRYRVSNRYKRVEPARMVPLSEIEVFISSGDIHSEIEAKELGRIISEFIYSLPDRRMYIFMSRYYVFRSIKEIARLLGCSEATVNKEIAVIKRSLKERLEKEGYSL